MHRVFPAVTLALGLAMVSSAVFHGSVRAAGVAAEVAALSAARMHSEPAAPEVAKIFPEDPHLLPAPAPTPAPAPAPAVQQQAKAEPPAVSHASTPPAQGSTAPQPARPDFISTNPSIVIPIQDDGESSMDAVLSLVVVDSRVSPPRVSESFWPVVMSMHDCRARMEGEIRHFMGATGLGAPDLPVSHYHDIARSEFAGGIVHADCRAAH